MAKLADCLAKAKDILAQDDVDMIEGAYEHLLMQGHSPEVAAVNAVESVIDVAIKARAEIAAKAAKAGAVVPDAPAAPNDFAAIFKEELDAAYGKKKSAKPRASRGTSQKAQPKPKVKSAAKSAKSAAVNTAKGIDEAMSALTTLFGAKGNRLGSGPTFDEETYRQALPHFKAAVRHFKAAGDDIRQLVRAVVRYFQEHGMERSTLENMMPSLQRFTEDVQAGRESIDEDSTRVREPAPGLPQGGEAPDSQGSGGGRGADDVPQQRRPKRGGTVRGPGSPDDGRPEPADRSGAEDGGPRGDSADSGRDRPRKRNLSAELTRREKERQARAQRNYRITDADRIGQGSAREKVRANIEAIRVLKSLEGRPATPEEKAKLVKYVGWGAFAQDLFQAHGAKEGWAQERKDLQNLLDTKEWEAARASTTNAHYTSQDVIKGMWDAIEHLGFKGGRALEPSAGVGHFIGLIPDRIQAATDWSAVELDPTTGGIAKALYAGADVNVQGFETFVRPSGFYDLAVSNVPFGNYKLRDPSYPRLSIHDYFFVKSLDKVRPGGLVAFITSAHTMDKMDDRARREIAKRGELVGAIRLPGGRKGAFAGNAGTEVTTDILFLRRKPDGAPDSPIAQKWDGLTEISTKDGPVKINEYFAKNPQMMLGEPRLTGTMYASKEFQLEPYTDDRGTLQEQMALAVTQMPALVMTSGANTIEEAPLATVEVNGAKPGAFFFDKGAIYQNIEGVGVKQEKMSGADVDRIRALIPIRDTINQLLGNQAAGNNVDNDLLRKRLNKAYDAFVKEFGPINKTTVTVTDRLDARGENVVIRKMPNFNAFKRDPDAYKVAAIEMYDADRDEAKKAAIFETDVAGVVPDPVIASPLDTIAVSLNKHGRLDIADMADMAGVTEDELIEALGDRVFLNPKGAVYETAEQYLSGDVVTKLSDARAAAQSDPDYQKNVDALEKVQPTPLTREDIGINFGSSWVPKEVFQQFLAEEADAQVELAFNDYAKSWAIKTAYRSEAAQAKYGTSRVEYKQIIAAAMNSTPLRVMDRNADGTETLNQDATMEARAKIEALQTAFTGDREKGIDAWVWKDDERAAYLEGLYNAGFNRIVPQKFDGSHLTFPGLAKSIKKTSGEIVPFSLLKHQKDAVWRIIQNGNTLLDHVVGAGKTFTMIVAGMEMRRLGQISRPVFTVPNHMLEQFSREFLQAYPGANILVANKDEMDRDNRRAFAAKVSAQKWDGIIMTHSGFSRVSMSPAAYEEYLRAELADAEEAIAQTREDEGRKSPTVKEIEKAKKRIETKLADLLKKEAKDVGITFEELGIDTIFVDEAHLFKNLNFFTRHTRVKGLAQGASQRATDLFMKIQHIDKRRPGRSAIFATGTPISNTMAEAYTMQRYLQLDKLRELGIDRFDAWASTFGKLRTAMELAPDGRTLQEVTSFSKFVNIPEMMNIFGLVSDTKTAADLNLPRPTLATGKPIVVEAEPDGMEENYIQDLIERARTVKGKKVEKGGDNMLKIVGDGRKVATDRRLIFGDVGINPNGKVAKAVDNIFRIYQAGVDPALVQTVFLDLGTPKTRGKGKAQTKTVEDPDTGEEIEVSLDEAEIFLSAFNIYDDMRTRLVQKGIPLKEIAFIHDATDDVKKAQMFDKARRGKIRVLFGSTSKMGVGTNIPDRLIAQHEIDAPWKPAEVEQRGGRIVRQGNLNPEVSIYRYITKRSFDAFMWQTLERKAGFIAQLKAGARGIREAEDIDSPLPDAAELKAAATGDPRIMQYAELQKEVRNLDIAQTSHFRTISSAKMALGQQRSDKARHEKAIAVLEADNAKVTDTRGDAFTVEIIVGEKPGEYTARKEAGDQIVKFAVGQMDRVWGKTEYTVGRLSGFTMKLIVSRDKDGRHVYEARLEGEGKYERWGSAAFLTPDTEGSPLVQQYERLLRDIPDKLDFEKRQLARVEEAIPKLEVTAQEKPFPRGDELREKKAKLKALEDELRPKKEDAAAPAGPVQPSFGLTGITEKVRENIAEDVQRYARRILGHEITVRVVRKIVDAQGRDTGMAGAYSNRDKAVFIALDHAVNWRGTLRHEAIHALRDAGVITPAEWKVLSRYAEKIWMPRNPHIRENYEGYYRDKFTALSAAEIEDVVVEEGVADVFERERLGTLPDNVPGAIRRLIRKILDFMERVRNLVEGAGFKTAGDIFGEIESGRAIERERRQENRRGYELVDRDEVLASRPMPPSRGPVTFQAPIDNPAAVWALTNLPLLERLENTAGAAWRPVRAKMQDSMIDWARVQKEIEKQRGPIHAAADVYRTEILYSGRTGKRIDDFRENDVIPLINAMAAEGVTQDDLWDYLSAKYAPKRNAQIARIDPSMPDGGSGITDAEAVQMLRDLHSRGALLRTARIARKVYAIRDATRDRLLANGIISQRQYDELVKEPFYVPFQGFRDNAPDEATRLAIGMKYDTRAAPVKRALGRKSKADSPLAYVLAQAQQSIVLSEKARVGRTVLRLALDHPQSELWEVNQVVKVKYLDKQTGMVATFHDGRQRTMAPNVLAVRQGGKLYWVTLHHKGLLEGIKGIEGSQMNVILRAMAKLQRFYALVRTAWSPQFFITNFARDLETAAIHISAEQGARIVKNTIRDIPKAIAATWRHETMGQRTGNQWVQFAEEHALAGGKVGIFGLYSIEDTKRKITKELKLAAGGPTVNLEKAADRAMELMSGVNGAIENAIRLSLYVNMIREGFTRDQAAIASKEVTVNFNRKGTWGSNVNAFYVFFNAGAQGITRVVSVMRKYPKVRAALLGTIAAGFLLDMANAWMSGDSDDDGEDDYDQLPEYITERNLVFMWPWSEEGEHSKVPLTWVYNVFPYAGQQLGRTVRGKISPWTAAANVISAAARSMNPLGATNVGEMLSPTFLDPLYQLRGNRDGLDRPIMPEQKDYQVPKPDSQLYFKSVNPTLRELSAWLNTLPMPWKAGGDEIRPGPIDVSPEILEFWVDFIGGGLGGFINQVQTTVTDLASGEIPESEKIPLGRVIYGKLPERVGRNEFYEIKAKIELALEQVKTFEEKGDRRKVAEIRRDYRVDLRMADSLKEAEKSLKEIKKRINEAKTTAQRRHWEEERDRVMSRFRRRYRSLGGKL